MAAMWNKLKKAFLLKHSESPPLATPLPVESPANTSPRSSTSLCRLSRSFSVKSSYTKTCAICLMNVKTGKGQAIFTAECAHSFHFSCIASSVQHGYHDCPICRSKWKELPVQFPTSTAGRQRNGGGLVRVSLHQNPAENNAHNLPLPLDTTVISPTPEVLPIRYSDDEPLTALSADSTSSNTSDCSESVTVKAVAEFPAIASSAIVSKFAVLVGVRAPSLSDDAPNSKRAPIDLVIVLDVSGSMDGSKLSLLKRAAQFVIQNLGPTDRLSIVVFSSNARRIFPLRKMTDRGRDDAIIAIRSLSANGGTNIMEGLRQGARIIHERREKNPVASIILLSDGKDTYNLHYINEPRTPSNQNSNMSRQVLDQLNIWLNPIRWDNQEAETETRPINIPIHTFGFGTDHDPDIMHAISDASGGTFSFIQSDGLVQDAFARCIGGLLSVVAQELCLNVKSVSSGVRIESIPSGKYVNDIFQEGKEGVIEVGDLYADEEKEFLVYLTVPVLSSTETNGGLATTSLLDVKCSYKDVVSMEMREVECRTVELQRPDILCSADLIPSLEVDRQKNRIWVAEGIAEAHEMAEQGNLDGANVLLKNRRSVLLHSPSAQAGDGLCIWLEAELNEIRERMVSMEMYQLNGRAYMRSGMSSHSWQRSTTRGSSTSQNTQGDSSSNTGQLGYDTPSMVSMVTKSQTLNFQNHPEQVERANKSCVLSSKP
ncbi:hypothetical protein ACET3Z_003556 [Daucus carota]